MKIGPGVWCEDLFDGAKTVPIGSEHTFLSSGEETTNQVLAKAQEWVSSCSVVIATIWKPRDDKSQLQMKAGSGVIVQLRNEIYGLLTAAHVLSQGDNNRDGAEVTLFASPRNWDRAQGIKSFNLRRRKFTAVGFDNKAQDGPDLAILPLARWEWTHLHSLGMVAYNLDKQRWADRDRAKLRGVNSWCISVISGLRWTASLITLRHSEGSRLPVAILTTTTRVEDGGERGGYDFLELDSETTGDSYPTHWKHGLPGTAEEEIEELHGGKVTPSAWGGISGAGVWNLVVEANESGQPDGIVLGELTGICFFANPQKGCIVAHGPKSIKKIATSFIEEGSWASIP